LRQQLLVFESLDLQQNHMPSLPTDPASTTGGVLGSRLPVVSSIALDPRQKGPWCLIQSHESLTDGSMVRTAYGVLHSRLLRWVLCSIV
jgi:hypothetical protein